MNSPMSCCVVVLQIRAANLSGDCAFGMEFVRGNLSEALVGQHKRCVRRRALLSVSLNPYCQVRAGLCWVCLE